MDIYPRDLPEIAEQFHPKRAPFSPCTAYFFSLGPEWFDGNDKLQVEFDDVNFSYLGQRLKTALDKGFLQRMTPADLEKLWDGGYSQLLEHVSQASLTKEQEEVKEGLTGLRDKVIGMISGIGAISFFSTKSISEDYFRPREDIGIYFSSRERAIQAAKAVTGRFPDSFSFFTHDVEPHDERVEFLKPTPYKRLDYGIDGSYFRTHTRDLLRTFLAERRKKEPTLGYYSAEFSEQNVNIGHNLIARIGTPEEIARQLPKGETQVSENMVTVDGRNFAFDSALTAKAVAEALRK